MRISILSVFSALVLLTGPALVSAENPLEYNRDIRPIFNDVCFSCHGADSASRKADLRLDQRDAAIDMGAIVEGDPDASEMILRILSSDPKKVMPPPETKKTLSAEQKEKLARWIKEGAKYELHWSFIPPTRPTPPAVKNAGWVRNPIDNFILARLEAEGLAPAPEADRRALCRRVSLDLTGLPPEPAVVESFVNDTSPDAYEKLVASLLTSKKWGEHRGRYWLDYARYADTHGIHFDNFREMWTYRDWVIRAYNDNLPFDLFTVISLAGDLMPNRTVDQQVGSGFNRCNMTTNEGGIIDEEYLVLYTRDRTEATSQVWMGLTAGCAVCHNHKFDPLSQREFYEMAAFFNNTTIGARDGNIKDSPPIIRTAIEEDRPRIEELKAIIPATRQQLEARQTVARSEFEKWLAAVPAGSLGTPAPEEGQHFHAPLDEGQGQQISVTVAGTSRQGALNSSVKWEAGPSGQALRVQGAAAEFSDVGDFEKDKPFSCAAWINLPPNDSSGAICARMDNGNNYRGWDFWMQRRQVGTHVVNAWPNNALKVVAKNQMAANQWVHATVTYDGSGRAAGVRIYYDGVPQETLVENDSLSETIKTGVPFKIGQRSAKEPISAALQGLRVYQRVLLPGEVEALAKSSRFASILAKPADQRTDDDKNALFGHWLKTSDKEYLEIEKRLMDFEREEKELSSRGAIAYVMQEKNEPAMAFILSRGEYDQRLDQVTPDTPDILPPFPADYPRNRLGFAKWLLLPDQPLTARVTANRFWQEVFGVGIVKTTGDFGVSGQLPTHPELLDWLAVEFRESGWDVKKLFTLMVTSAAYRQAAVTTPEKIEKDPENRLLARGPRFRMDAEMVRDHALAASGLLVPKIGGPSVKPYQPPGVWEAIAMNVSNTKAYQRDTGENLYRRSVYTFIKRMAPPASLDIFNAPNREVCTVRRERTNTPLQALVTLNDEQFIEAARHLATRALKEGGDSPESRLKLVAIQLLARELRPEEATIVRGSLDALLGHYRAHPEDATKLIAVGESKPDPALDPPTLAAWTMLTNELMNLDEVLNK